MGVVKNFEFSGDGIYVLPRSTTSGNDNFQSHDTKNKKSKDYKCLPFVK